MGYSRRWVYRALYFCQRASSMKSQDGDVSGGNADALDQDRLALGEAGKFLPVGRALGGARHCE